MDGTDEDRVERSRRSRAPLPPLLSGLGFWAFAIFFLGVAFVAGLGVIISEDQWWAKVCGGLVSLLCVMLAVAAIVYLRRPVVEPTEADLVDPRTLADWSDAFRRNGHLEIGLSAAKLVKTFGGIGILLVGSILMILGLTGPVGIVLGIVILGMISLLGLLPHLEFATGGRPAIGIDGHGIEIARWGRLTIPWDQLEAVGVHRSTATQSNVIVVVTPSFFADYATSRSLPLRSVDTLVRAIVSRGRWFSIPSTTAPNAETLGTWLEAEVQRRKVSGAR